MEMAAMEPFWLPLTMSEMAARLAVVGDKGQSSSAKLTMG
jgi:hypothetical protein